MTVNVVVVVVVVTLCIKCSSNVRASQCPGSPRSDLEVSQSMWYHERLLQS